MEKEAVMIRATLFGLAAVTASFVMSPQPVAAREAPWCAVISLAEDAVYWDCQYNSFEQCRPVILAGNRGWCNVNPYATAEPQQKPHGKRRARTN
jgi:hypothetical protein